MDGKLPKELKNGVEILVGQATCKLWIKTVKMLFGSNTQEPLVWVKHSRTAWPT